MDTPVLNENNMLNQKEHETALILSNAAELTAAVIKKVAGNDISTALNGSPLTREVIHNLVLSKLTEKLTQA